MATVRKRGNGYYIEVLIGVDGSGNRIRKNSTFTPQAGLTPKQEKDALNRAVVEFENKAKSGQCLDGETLTLKEFAMDQWLPNHALKQLKPKTVSEYKEILSKRILPALGHLKMSQIRPLQIIRFLNELDEKGLKYIARFVAKSDISEKLKVHKLTAEKIGVCSNSLTKVRHGEKVSEEVANKISEALGEKISDSFQVVGSDEVLSASSKIHYFRCLSSIMSTAVKWQVIHENPCMRVDSPKHDQKEIKYLEYDEAVRIFAAAIELDDMRIRTAAIMLMFTGMREGELAGLEWQDFDFEKNEIHIKRNSQYIRGEGLITCSPKTFAGNRVVSISIELVECLLDYQEWQNEQRIQCGDQWIKTDRLFTTWNGGYIHPSTIGTWVKAFLKDNGHPEMTVHGLRHTNVTMMIANGTDIRTIAGRVGHANSSTTMNVYAHFLKSSNAKASDQLNLGLFAKK